MHVLPNCQPFVFHDWRALDSRQCGNDDVSELFNEENHCCEPSPLSRWKRCFLFFEQGHGVNTLPRLFS